jgi:hypothetical protein
MITISFGTTDKPLTAELDAELVWRCAELPEIAALLNSQAAGIVIPAAHPDPALAIAEAALQITGGAITQAAEAPFDPEVVY